MKIITYSDLHLEFGTDFKPPRQREADLMILAGDIITFRDYEPLREFLSNWEKPVIFIAGNHEFYTNTSMITEAENFKNWLKKNHPYVHFLQDEAITINNIHFFGGTMWTDFQQSSEKAMLEAKRGMNDFRLIKVNNDITLTPQYTVNFHEIFFKKLTEWFKKKLNGKRVVISHHAPIINPKTKYSNSSLSPAFNSTDMIPLIEQYQPDLWIYGHTHECDDHTLEKTRIISNQMGYLNHFGEYECSNFAPNGKPIIL